MKKLLRRILCFGLIIMLLPVGSLPVQAETASQEGIYSVTDTGAEPINTALDAFEYLLNETDKTVTLTRYIGADSQVVISGPYVINGVSYQPVLDSATLFKGNTTITSVTIGEDVGYRGNSMSYLFGECSKLVEIDLSAVDTSFVIDMSYLFYKCSALTTIDLAGLDTENVTTMRGMFSYCTKLSSLSGYEDWDTSSLEVMYHMFNRVASAVESIECIDLSNWDLDQVTNTGWCFQLCYAKQILLPENLAVISAGFLNHAAKVTGTSYTIPAGVKKIGYAHTIYDFATDDFTEFIVAEGNTDYKAIDGILYSADGTEMLAVPRNKTFTDGIYEIPEGVSFLGELSFSRNYNIHTLILPDSYEIKYVPVYDPEYIVFEDVGNLNAGTNLSIAIYCYTGITEYQVKESNSRYASKNGIIYSKDLTEVVAVPARYAQEMVIPEGVTTWNKEAMWADFENNSQNTLANLLVNCTGVSIPSTLRKMSDDQMEMLNLLYTKRVGTENPFTITIADGNRSFKLDEDGELCRSCEHEYASVVTVPTCLEQGYTTHTCSVCTDSYVDSYTDALGHSFTTYTSDVDTSNKPVGTKTAKCNRCNVTDTVADEMHVINQHYTFAGKSALFFGDSITYGWVSGLFGRTENHYPKLFSEAVGLTYTNYGINGSTIGGAVSGRVYILDTIKSQTLDSDYLFVAGGINDWAVGVPLSTFEVGVENLCAYLAENYEGEVIFITPINHAGYERGITPIADVQLYRDAITVTAVKYGFNVVQGNLLGFPTANSDASLISSMFADKLHPTELGYSHYATQLQKAFDKEYSVVVTDSTCTEKGYTAHTCMVCSESYVDSYTDALGHSLGAWEIVKEATCTEEGNQQKDCANCDYYETEIIPALGHNPSEEWTIVKLANCTEAGRKYHICTNGCGTQLDIMVIPAIGHSIGVWTTIKEATCTEAGSKRRDCNTCDYYEVNTLQKLSHSYEAVVIVPTCTEKGYTSFSCENCGDSYEDNYTDKLGHSYVSVVTPPTCTEKGYTSYLCLKCQHSYVDEYTDPIHTPVVDKAVAPTCTTTGLTEGSHCELCEEVLVSQEVVPVTDHNFGDWYETVIPTCEKIGVQRRDCIDCDAFKTEEITCGHEATEPWDVDGDNVLEILAIGNSFSIDSLEYAYQIAESLGIKEVVIGNLYFGGGSLKVHYSNAANDSAAYKYYYNDNGTWETTDNYKISTALTERSWDYISLQQESGDSGTESTYNSDLTNLISYIRSVISPESNPNRNQCAKIVWHMTWAYQKDSANTNFAKYDNDQMTMYNSIVSAVENKIVTNKDISVVIPVGTTIQNTRTSFIGDILTRDGEHLTTVYGRYVAGLTFIKSITGLTLTEDVYVPYGVSDEYKTIAIESANNAYQKPFEVTDSMYPPHVHDYDFVVTPPTCVKKGYTTYSCEGCGHSYVDDYVDATGNHSYKAGVCTICEKSVLIKGWITPKFAKGDYTMAVIPDPQICVARKPESYYKMTNWIVNNKDSYNIKAVLHVGDMVDNNHDAEWIVTKKGMDMINDAGIPWMPMRGNHDNSDYFNNYFDYTIYGTNQSWFGGSYEGGKLDQTYWFVTVKDREYMILSLGWAPDWDVLDWAAGIVEKYPEKSVIIVAHAYMYRDGTLLSKDDKYSVNFYPGYDGYPEGEDIWAKFKKYENVVLAMGGHIGSSNVATYTDKNGAGKNVTSLLADNQDNDKKDPLGMLLLLTFHEDSDVVDINWYSAEYDALYRAQNQFSITVPHVCKHQYTAEVIKPTCLKEGYTLHICSLCDKSYTDTPTKALGHTWNTGVITTKPTALAPGVKTYTCSTCKSTKTEEVAFEGYDVKRIWGSSRYNTSLAIADELKAELGIERFETVIIASGENFPDALAGSYLAAEKDAPILMTDGKSNLESLYQYIDENVNSKGQIYILGGTGAVPDNVFDALKGKGYKVERLKGKGRYETNIEILKEAGTNGKEILVCTGTDFADSLSASAADLPILLVDGKGKLSDAQKEYLSTIKGSKFCIVGGSGVVSTSIENELTAYGTVERVYGKGRYETSVAFAERYFDNPDMAVIAYAWNFPDGLCGGPLAAKSNAPLILTGADKTDGKKPTTEQEATAAGAAVAYIKTHKMESGIVLGGTGVLSDNTVNIVFDLK